MRELPIPFTTEMVRAILEGRKWQTRRVIKPQPRLYDNNLMGFNNGRKSSLVCDITMALRMIPNYAPYQVGDLLWVKETWGITPDKYHRICYKADLQYPEGRPVEGKWKSPRFMHKAYARLWLLEVTAVRAERLQEISIEDIKAEGVFDEINSYNPARQLYAMRKLWDSTNPKYPWSSNPWVWVYEFKKAGD